MFQRSNAAYERALSLDPNRVLAASNLIVNRVERGELGRAYDAATDLVRRRPQSADAHFALSYVLRYAGMQEKATQECNTARSLDPGNFNFRSCAWAFLELGQTDRAMDFVHLDAGSEWAAWVTPYVYLAAGNVAQARESGEECGEGSRLPPGVAGGMHAGAASGRHGPDCAGGGIVGDDGARSGGVVSRGSADGVLRAEGCGADAC